MNIVKKGCLVVPYWQPGATFKTFDENAFTEDICVPLLDIFTTCGHSIDMVLIVVRCLGKNETNSDVEVGRWDILPGEGLPEHVITPTATAVLKSLGSFWEKGKVACLNVPDARDNDDAIDRAVRFARSDGFESVIIPPEVPIPADVCGIEELLRTAMSTGCPIQYHVPHPQTVAGPIV
jgi:hypothetical protein